MGATGLRRSERASAARSSLRMAKATIGARSNLDYGPLGCGVRLTCTGGEWAKKARRKSATRDAFSFVPVTD